MKYCLIVETFCIMFISSCLAHLSVHLTGTCVCCMYNHWYGGRGGAERGVRYMNIFRSDYFFVT